MLRGACMLIMEYECVHGNNWLPIPYYNYCAWHGFKGHASIQ